MAEELFWNLDFLSIVALTDDEGNERALEDARASQTGISDGTTRAYAMAGSPGPVALVGAISRGLEWVGLLVTLRKESKSKCWMTSCKSIQS